MLTDFEIQVLTQAMNIIDVTPAEVLGLEQRGKEQVSIKLYDIVQTQSLPASLRPGF
jgi:alpha-D-ribose 1-methylphosphonate 5-triphosphate diphosphatase PhnM